MTGRRPCRSDLALALGFVLAACSSDPSPPDDELQRPLDAATRDAALDGGARPLDAARERDDADALTDAQTDATQTNDPLTVRVREGVLHGRYDQDTRLFLGIPYAEPPLGPLRYAPPRPIAPWAAPRDAGAYGPACPQPLDALSSPAPHAEDCLFVNVATPKDAQRAPVMVFLHGGGFHIGAGSDYPLGALSRSGDVVVVTVNYRIGPLGFLTHAALDQELGTTSGNMGLRDQQLALKWVRANIAAFGGDPDDVTLFGESAGAISTCMHMFIPSSAGLAQRFLMQSGTCAHGFIAPGPRAKVAALSDELVADLCKGRADVAACLREIPADTLGNWLGKQATENLKFAPAGSDPPRNQDWYSYVDGEFLTQAPRELLRAGKFAQKPVLLGSNLHEWGLMQHYGFPRATNRLDFVFWLSLLHPEHTNEILLEYLPADDASADLALESVYTDEWFRCPSRALARELEAQGVASYLYSYEVAPGFHSQELDYVFGPSSRNVALPKEPYRPTDTALIEAMHGYWTRFARTGDPNGGAQPSWPKYERAKDQHLTLAETVQVGSKLTEGHCDFWDRLWASEQP